MFKKAGRLGIALLVIVPLLALAWVIFLNSEVGMAQDIGIQFPGLPSCDYSTIPQAVIDSAVITATELVGSSQKNLQNMVDQLLAAYQEAKGRDFVIVFNSGGWGGNIQQARTGWGSILEGIKGQLESQGYQSLVINYRRTGGGLTGAFREFCEAATSYPKKARELAMSIQFLTDNVPDMKVIVAGESTGTVISDKVMAILKNEPRVYSIQTGTPFWHKPTALDRVLLVNDNGVTIDAFSYGDVPAVVWATVRSWFGMPPPEEKAGHILFWLKAPGHDYSWQYPGVYDRIVNFIKKNFGNDN